MRAASAEQAQDAQDPHSLVEKKPSDSYLCIDLDFGSNSSLRDQYRTFVDTVRVGKLLEDLDAFAGNIAFKHADDGQANTRPLTLVTAAVDRMDMQSSIPVDVDLRVEGQVTWVGRSSMEIGVEVVRKDMAADSPSARLLTASFLMVARDNRTGKSAQVNPLRLETEQDKAAFALGAQRKQQRDEERLSSLHRVPPTLEEVSLMHSLFLRDCYADTVGTGVASLASTQLQSVSLCQPQDRNTNNKIFGGYLMRKAYELSHSTAQVYSAGFCAAASLGAVAPFSPPVVGNAAAAAAATDLSSSSSVPPCSRPRLLAVDDISFVRPVEIGSIITCTSRVVAVQHGPAAAAADAPRAGCSAADAKDSHMASLLHAGTSAFQVRTDTRIVDLNSGTAHTSNEFHFTFLCDHHRGASSNTGGGGGGGPRDIVPQSYGDAMLLLDGRRRLFTGLTLATQHGSGVLTPLQQ